VKAIAAADINGDSQPDLVATRVSGTSFLCIALSTGGGTFGSTTTYAVGANPLALTVGDIDGDSDIDVVTANTTAMNMSVMLNNGSGVFSAGTSVPMTFAASAIALADCDGDAVLDLVVGYDDFPSVSDISVQHGDGAGGFGARVLYSCGVS